MLVLSRRADESIVIQPADGVDGNMTMAQLFANGPIQITLLGGTGRRVKMGILSNSPFGAKIAPESGRRRTRRPLILHISTARLTYLY